MTEGGRIGRRFWIGVTIGILAVSVAFAVAGMPSPFLLGGLTVGCAAALSRSSSADLPDGARSLALAIIGVGAGSMIDGAVLATVADYPVAVVGGVAATLATSLIAGALLCLSPLVDARTAVFSSIAGGAAGVSAMARELGANESIVTTVQYLRVLVVVGTVPVAAVLLGSSAASPSSPADPVESRMDWVLAASAVATGLVIVRFIRFSANALVLPLLVAVALTNGPLAESFEVPTVVLNLAYALVGLMVGLSFDRERLHQIRRLMPLILLQGVLSILGCAAIGLAFARLVAVDPLDGYLATTPGGLPAVTAVAIASSENVALIVSMQLVRLVSALCLVPLIAALLQRRRGPRAT